MYSFADDSDRFDDRDDRYFPFAEDCPCCGAPLASVDCCGVPTLRAILARVLVEAVGLDEDAVSKARRALKHTSDGLTTEAPKVTRAPVIAAWAAAAKAAQEDREQRAMARVAALLFGEGGV